MRFLADENFNRKVLNGLQAVLPAAEIVRIQDTDLFGAADPVILEWAAKKNLILLTHDVKTMTKYAYERIEAGLPMPGIIEVSTAISIGKAIEELSLLLGAGKAADFENYVWYVPVQ